MNKYLHFYGKVIFMFYFKLEPVKVQGYNAYLQWNHGFRECITISDDSGVFCENMIVYHECLFRQGFQNRPCYNCVTNHDEWLNSPCKLIDVDIHNDDCYHCGNDCHL